MEVLMSSAVLQTQSQRSSHKRGQYNITIGPIHDYDVDYKKTQLLATLEYNHGL